MKIPILAFILMNTVFDLSHASSVATAPTVAVAVTAQAADAGFLLHNAARKLDLEEMKKYLELGANPTLVDAEGETPLRLVILAIPALQQKNQGLEIAKLLLNHPSIVVDYNLFVHTNREQERSKGKLNRSILKPPHLEWHISELGQIIDLMKIKNPKVAAAYEPVVVLNQKQREESSK